MSHCTNVGGSFFVFVVIATYITLAARTMNSWGLLGTSGVW